MTSFAKVGWGQTEGGNGRGKKGACNIMPPSAIFNLEPLDHAYGSKAPIVSMTLILTQNIWLLNLIARHVEVKCMLTLKSVTNSAVLTIIN